MNWLVGVGIASVGAVLLQMLAEEFRDWCPWLAERLIRWAVRQLPAADRGRYEEEWLAELGQLPGKLAKLLMAVGILLRARQMAGVLRGHAVPSRGRALLSRGGWSSSWPSPPVPRSRQHWCCP